MEKAKSIALILGVLAMSVFVGYFIFAWTEPTQPPPQGNVPAPINVGPQGQAKEGGLILNTGGAPIGLIVQSGNVGIGTTTPAEKLDIQGGGIKIGNFKVKPISGTELGLYDSAGNLIVIFDQGT